MKKKKINKKNTTHPKTLLKTCQVKSTFFFKSNTLFSYKVNLLVSPIFEILSLLFEYHFNIPFL